jgi:hypothetical protein
MSVPQLIGNYHLHRKLLFTQEVIYYLRRAREETRERGLGGEARPREDECVEQLRNRRADVEEVQVHCVQGLQGPGPSLRPQTRPRLRLRHSLHFLHSLHSAPRLPPALYIYIYMYMYI